ncbi:hypothetical protein BDAP_002065 [Binucleata daphniae]
MKNINFETHNAAIDFQNKLNELKKLCTAQVNLSDTLIDCNNSFSRLESFVNINKKIKQNVDVNSNEDNLVVAKKSNQLTYMQYTKHNFTCTVIVHDNFGIISVETNNYMLNEILFKRLKIDNISDILGMYYDFECRNCDICGMYKENGADVRQKEENYISAYHTECAYKIDEK